MFPLVEARAHASACYPREACGLWLERDGGIFFRSCAPSKVADHFSISPLEWLEAERAGAIREFFHSHPDAPPIPSRGDMVALEAWGVPWVIMSWPSGEVAEFEPQCRPKSILGRSYQFGTDDCFGLVRDYYMRLGIEVPNVNRQPDWWKRGENMYADHWEECGFVRVKAPQIHDLLAIQVASDVPNHGAIYLGDNRILHHMEGKLSARAVYGEFYRRATTLILRHRDLC